MTLQRRTPAAENTSSSTQIELLSAGDHDARLVFVADLGLQHKEFKGEDKGNVQQIALGFEVVGETITVDGVEKPRLLWSKPFNIYNTMTEKGTELKMYKVFEPTAKEGEIPDWEAQLGKPCNLVIIHKQGTGANSGKFFDNVEAVTPIPAKYQDDVKNHTLPTAVGDNEVIQEHLYGLAKFVYDNQVKADY